MSENNDSNDDNKIKNKNNKDENNENKNIVVIKSKRGMKNNWIPLHFKDPSEEFPLPNKKNNKKSQINIKFVCIALIL